MRQRVAKELYKCFAEWSCFSALFLGTKNHLQHAIAFGQSFAAAAGICLNNLYPKVFRARVICIPFVSA